jgi:hypothetical protein
MIALRVFVTRSEFPMRYGGVRREAAAVCLGWFVSAERDCPVKAKQATIGFCTATMLSYQDYSAR